MSDVAEYMRPERLDEALTVAASGARIAAGCTDLFPATTRQVLPGPILDITGVGALRGVSQTGDGWRIGGATTWTDIICADLPPAFDGLKAAAREVGSVQIQNAGTIGGNLCNASPAADGVPPLLTLNAEVELTSASGARRLPLGRFLTGVRETALAPGEILTAAHIPRCGGASTFMKLGARKYLVISIAMVAARIEQEAGLITGAALSIGSCSAVAVRLREAEAALTGAPLRNAASDVAGRLTDDLIRPALSPISDIRGDDAYRAEAACELLRRAVGSLCLAERAQ